MSTADSPMQADACENVESYHANGRSRTSGHRCTHKIASIIHFLPGCETVVQKWRATHPGFVCLAWTEDAIADVWRYQVQHSGARARAGFGTPAHNFVDAMALTYAFGGFAIAAPYEPSGSLTALAYTSNTANVIVFGEEHAVEPTFAACVARCNEFAEIFRRIMLDKGKPVLQQARDTLDEYKRGGTISVKSTSSMKTLVVRAGVDPLGGVLGSVRGKKIDARNYGRPYVRGLAQQLCGLGAYLTYEPPFDIILFESEGPALVSALQNAAELQTRLHGARPGTLLVFKGDRGEVAADLFCVVQLVHLRARLLYRASAIVWRVCDNPSLLRLQPQLTE